MIVVDTNVVTYLLIKGQRSVIMESLRKKDPDWEVPFFWKSEFRNVLALQLQTQKINFVDSIKILRDAELLLKEHEHNVSSETVLTLAHESHCSAYDCEFVALAHQLNTFLVTEDKKILTTFPQTAISAEDFLKK